MTDKAKQAKYVPNITALLSEREAQGFHAFCETFGIRPDQGAPVLFRLGLTVWDQVLGDVIAARADSVLGAMNRVQAELQRAYRQSCETCPSKSGCPDYGKASLN